LKIGARIALMSIISSFWPSASSGDLSGSLVVDSRPDHDPDPWAMGRFAACY